MPRQKKRAFFSFLYIVLSICFIITTFTFSQDKKEEPRIFKGKVIDLSSKYITLGRTSIALPKNVIILDTNGSPIRFSEIQKGDVFIATVSQEKVVLQKSSGPEPIEKEQSLPR